MLGTLLVLNVWKVDTGHSASPRGQAHLGKKSWEIKKLISSPWSWSPTVEMPTHPGVLTGTRGRPNLDKLVAAKHAQFPGQGGLIAKWELGRGRSLEKSSPCRQGARRRRARAGGGASAARSSRPRLLLLAGRSGAAGFPSNRCAASF